MNPFCWLPGCEAVGATTIAGTTCCLVHVDVTIEMLARLFCGQAGAAREVAHPGPVKE